MCFFLCMAEVERRIYVCRVAWRYFPPYANWGEKRARELFEFSVMKFREQGRKMYFSRFSLTRRVTVENEKLTYVMFRRCVFLAWLSDGQMSRKYSHRCANKGGCSMVDSQIGEHVPRSGGISPDIMPTYLHLRYSNLEVIAGNG